MKSVRIITVNGGVFGEQARAIEYSLNELGVCEKAVIQDNAKVDFSKHYDFNFVIRAFRPFPIERIKGIKMIYQVEELWNRRERGFYDMGQGYDRALEMYDENLKIPAGTKNVVYCPVGYSPVWENKLTSTEEIDVLFYGSPTPRRKIFMSEISKMGLNVQFFGGPREKYYGSQRDEVIMKSKIVLNIKAYDRWSYGPMHCLPVQANKKFMLAEKADGGHGPFKPDVHFAEYNGIGKCKEAIRYWLDHDKERKEFAMNAYEDMVKTCDFTPILEEALGSHPDKNLPSLIDMPDVVSYKKHVAKYESKYTSMNIEPGQSSWNDMPEDYKKEWHRRNK